MKYGKISLSLGSRPAFGLGSTFKTAVAAMAGLVGTASFAVADVETFEIDPAHSNIGFKIKHLFTYVSGRFDEVQGSFVIDPQKPETASVKVSIPAKSINTGVKMRDDHLRGPDFFDVEKYPTLTYVSKSVKRTGENTADVEGDLTLHGVTKPVPLKVTFQGKGPGMQGETRSGWQAVGKLKRSDFGMTWGKAIEGTPLVGDEVEIVIDVEAVKK